MIFLKRFFANGFKSFATPTTIEFNNSMTAIVGPNGSGKSNVVDAIKWTIGEQSMKELRGNERNNLIFMGSEKFPESDSAIVELTFDNKNRRLSIDLDEVKITRKLMRKNNESFYFLNGEPAKLNDIKEIFLDTGLTRGSLGIISQGTVSFFSDSKPEDRRKIFEDAAGIGKYSKRKQETIRQLEQTENNLNLIQERLKTTERELNKLKTQSEKLELFQKYSERLKELDLTIKAKQYEINKANLSSFETQLESQNAKFIASNSNVKYYDDIIKTKNTELGRINEEVQKLDEKKDALQTQYNQLDSKYSIFMNNLNSDIDSGNIEQKISAYKAIIKSNNTIIETNQNNLKQHEPHYNKNLELKAKLELEQAQLSKEIQKMNTNTQIMLKDIEELKRIVEKQDSDSAINTILSHKDSFPGVINTVKNLVKVPNKFEMAIATALGNSAKNIVCRDEYSAKKAIEFLKNNKNGYLTFLPLDKIKQRNLPPEILNGIKGIKGFLGVGKDLIKYEDDYKNAIEHLLGNIVIAEDLNSATTIADITQQKIKIVTIEGDVKNIGGALSGGYKSDKNLIFNIREKLEEAQKKYNEVEEQLKNTLLADNQIKNKIVEITNLCSNLKLEIELTKAQIEEKTNDNVKNQINLEQLLAKTNLGKQNNEQEQQIKILTQNLTEIKTELGNIIVELNAKRVVLNNVTNEINIFHTERQENYLIAQEATSQIQSLQTNITNTQNQLEKIEAKCIEEYKISLEALKDEYLNRDIGMSESEANREVASLKNLISQLGNINPDVVNELAEKQKEFDYISLEFNNASEACEKLRSTIKELDEEAIKSFNKTINDVNANINAIFNEFFGDGGNCQIKLTDPDNILSSGIEIIVQPRGKKIKNLMLLSGGEKTLVALTILFAILKTSNLPLIVLDEAEAALDELNVEIFGKIVNKYSKQTQFLVITHRPGTMKEADTLYGVTMQDKGVSIVLRQSYDDYVNKQH